MLKPPRNLVKIFHLKKNYKFQIKCDIETNHYFEFENEREFIILIFININLKNDSVALSIYIFRIKFN